MKGLKAKIDDQEYQVDFTSTTKGTIDGKSFEMDVLQENEHRLHLIMDSKSYTVEIFGDKDNKKSFRVKVNGTYYDVVLSDKYDALLKDLGMESLKSAKHKDLKAPMPGLVLEVLVEPGQSVVENEPILILEAMKMENVIKSPAAGNILNIGVTKGQAVEKNEMLVEFE